MVSLGLDIGATKIRYLIWDGRRSKILIDREIKYAKRTRPEFVKTLKAVVADLQAKKINYGKIGVGIAGIIQKNRLSNTPNFLALEGLDIAAMIKKIFGKTPIVENDARAFAYAEALVGVGKKYRSVVGLTLGTGLGGGIVIDKKIYHGRGGAGEIGHIFIKSEIRNPKSKTKEAEDLASEKFFKSRGIKDPFAVEIKARAGDRKARKIYEEYGVNLGLIIADVINTLDPEAVVLGGGLAHAYDLFIKPVRRAIKHLSVDPAAKNTPILKSRFGKSGGAVGAALL